MNRRNILKAAAALAITPSLISKVTIPPVPYTGKVTGIWKGIDKIYSGSFVIDMNEFKPKGFGDFMNIISGLMEKEKSPKEVIDHMNELGHKVTYAEISKAEVHRGGPGNQPAD